MAGRHTNGAGGESGHDRELHELMAAYVAAIEAGLAPDREALLAAHPHLASELAEFLADHERLHRLAAPLRDAVAEGDLGSAFAAQRAVASTVGSRSGGSPSVLTTLWQRAGDAPHVLLREPPGDELPLVRPAGSDAGRYRLLGEIGRGGMGSVLRGHDPDLGRDLAIKVLLDRHRSDDEVLRRFVEEAQIAGQLQHPGVVPVYELGCFADRRPYFAMKLVKGRTLASLLYERSAPGDDLARFLGIFLQVAQTVAYAHARGVIHRDLKPTNVMVGAFGEVQVMDWGLAKVLPRGSVEEDRSAGQVPEHETVIATARSASDSDRSRAGSVLGTPAYMAPEQARGEVGRLDERADVFALGSILCEILTGKPAFTGRDSAEIQRRAARGDLGDALGRLASCGAEGELPGLASECLAPEALDRPRDGGVVASRLTAYQAAMEKRVRLAELERTAAAARADAERKARRATVSLAAAILALVVVGGGGWALWAFQRQERLGRARALMAEAEALRHRAVETPTDPTAWPRASAAVDRAAEALRGTADPGTAAHLRALRLRIDAEAKRGAAVRMLVATLEDIRASLDAVDDHRRVDAEFAAAFRRFGLDVDRAEPKRAGAELASSGAATEIATAIDVWATIRWELEGSWRRLLEVARATDSDPWRGALRARFGTQDSEELRRLVASSGSASQSVSTLHTLAVALRIAGDRTRMKDVLRDARRRHPEDFWVNHALAASLWNQSTAKFERPQEAIRFLSVSVALRPGSPSTHNSLGNALSDNAEFDAAVAEYREAKRLRPGWWLPYNNLGNALNATGQLDAAIAEFRAAIRLGPENAKPHIGLGNALKAKGNLDAAMPEYREAVRLAPDFSGARYNLGNALYHHGDIDSAIVELRAAIRLRPDFLYAHGMLGLAYEKRGSLDAAIAELREAVRLNPSYAKPHADLGRCLYEGKRDLNAAVAELREAIRLQPDFAEAHHDLGNALDDKLEQDAAIAEYREAIRLKTNYAEAHINLAIALRRKGQLRESLDEFRLGHEIGSRQPDWHKPSADWVRGAERLVALERRLPAVVRGNEAPSSIAERLEFARLCSLLRRHADAVRFYVEAFEAEPRAMADRNGQHPYNAACATVLAAASDETSQARLRQQGLDWLRLELVTWTKIVGAGDGPKREFAMRALRHWQRDPDLASVRDAERLAKLPEDERKAWEALWAEVASLVKP
jgi:serine/threonine-protein kinase